MNKYLKADAWCIVEEGFDPQNMRSSESIFSIGNGRFGQRANFEEGYSGDHMLGSKIIIAVLDQMKRLNQQVAISWRISK